MIIIYCSIRPVQHTSREQLDHSGTCTHVHMHVISNVMYIFLSEFLILCTCIHVLILYRRGNMCTSIQYIVLHDWLTLLYIFQDESDGHQVLWFLFQEVKYIYNRDTKAFSPIVFPLEYSAAHYTDWKGISDEVQLKNAERRYGLNK